MSNHKSPGQAREVVTKGGQADLASLAKGENDFALALYSHLKSSPDDIFLSPHSIFMALAMLHAGARGRTARQMAEVLHLPLEGERLHAAVRALQGEPGRERGYELDIANALWGQRGYDFRSEYLGILKDTFGAGLYEVDFASATEEARGRINEWVAERTRGRIPEVIPPDVLDPLARLVLTNAIFFKGKWESPFESWRTHESTFHLPSGRGDVRVSMMAQTHGFPYCEQGDVRLLEMPYRGDRFGMLFLLPGSVEGLPEVEAALEGGKLDSWLRGLKMQEVDVLLPRIKMTTGALLGDILRSMGMTEVFDVARADLSGITSVEDVCLSEVIHRTYLEVDELGTEAAAATALVAVGAGVDPNPPPVFRADHPFLFLIEDRQTGSILFMGRVCTAASLAPPLQEREFVDPDELTAEDPP